MAPRSPFPAISLPTMGKTWIIVSSFNVCETKWTHTSPVPTSRHGAAPVSIPADLQRAKFVVVRRDAHRTSPQRPYEGPFQVIVNGPKTFKIDMGGKTEIITVDRLKLAHLDVDSLVQLAQPRPRGRPPGKHTPAPTPLTPQPSTARLPQCARTGRQICPKSPAAMPPAPRPSPQCTRSGRQVRPNRRYICGLVDLFHMYIF